MSKFSFLIAAYVALLLAPSAHAAFVLGNPPIVGITHKKPHQNDLQEIVVGVIKQYNTEKSAGLSTDIQLIGKAGEGADTFGGTGISFFSAAKANASIAANTLNNYVSAYFTYSTPNSLAPLGLIYFSVKAGSGFTLYTFDPTALTAANMTKTVDGTTYYKLEGHELDGSVSTKEISHVSFWKGAVATDVRLVPAPEPTTFAIWGLCGIGAVVAGRRRIRRLAI